MTFVTVALLAAPLPRNGSAPLKERSEESAAKWESSNRLFDV